MKYLILASALLLSTTTFAAGGGESGGLKLGKGTSAWILFGAGTETPSSPLNTQLNYDLRLTVRLGIDVPVGGPVFFSVSGYGVNSDAKVNYNYTNAQKSSYSAQNVDLSQSSTGLQLGIQLRLLNASALHILVEGGGFAEERTMTYDFTNSVNGSGSASPELTQSYVTSLGTYACAGIDVLMPNGYGFRLLARAAKGSTSKIDALSGANMKYVNGEGYFGFIRQY